MEQKLPKWYMNVKEILDLLRIISIISCCVIASVIGIRFIHFEVSAQNDVDESHRVLLESGLMIAETRKQTADQEAFITKQLPQMAKSYYDTMERANKLIDSLTSTSNQLSISVKTLSDSGNAAVISANTAVKQLTPVLDNLSTTVKTTQPLIEQLTTTINDSDKTIKSVNAIVDQPAARSIPVNANKFLANSADTVKTFDDGMKAYFHPALWQKVFDGVRTATSVVQTGITAGAAGVWKGISKVF